jgi:hypothetical protein
MTRALIPDKGSSWILDIAGSAALNTPHTNCQARGGLSDAELSFNSQMSRLRVSVELIFGMIKRSWSYIDRRHRVYKDNLSAHVRIAALLMNFLTYSQGGNQASDIFGLLPPSLEEYLQSSL